MRKEAIEMLLRDFKMLSYCRVKEPGVPQGVWFVFEARPLPPPDEIQMVMADIENSAGANISLDGSLRHLSKCCAQNHDIPKQLEKVISKIENQVFQIALWEGLPTFLSGQPIAISLQPEISYFSFPDHPHISSGVIDGDFCTPDFLCYTDNPEGLGANPYDRIDNAIQDICMWLFRHQVWLATRSIGSPYWIGPQVNAKEEEQFFYLRNPYSQCYCRRGKQYYLCHLQQNFIDACSIDPRFNIFRKENGNINMALYHKWWVEKRYNNQYRSLNILRRVLATQCLV